MDEGWDSNEVILEDVAAVPEKSAVNALVTASIQGSGAEADDKSSPTEGLLRSTREPPHQALPSLAKAQCKPSAQVTPAPHLFYARQGQIAVKEIAGLRPWVSPSTSTLTAC